MLLLKMRSTSSNFKFILSHHYKTTFNHGMCWLCQILVQFQTLQILEPCTNKNKVQNKEERCSTDQILILYLNKSKINDFNGIKKIKSFHFILWIKIYPIMLCLWYHIEVDGIAKQKAILSGFLTLK